MLKNFQITDEKLLKAKAIEGMLTELNMSKQELIDLIKSLLENSVGHEAEQELDVNDIGLEQLLGEKDIEGIEGDVTIEAVAVEIADNNVDFLARFLSLVDLKKLMVKVSFALSMKRLRESGLLQMQQEALASGLAGIDNASVLQMTGSYEDAEGKKKFLQLEEMVKFTNEFNAIALNPQLLRATFAGQQMMRDVEQKLNDPNSLSNANSSVNVVNRVVSSVKMQMQSYGNAVSNTMNNSASLGAARQQQAQQQQVQRMQNQTRTMQRVFTNMRRHDRKLKGMFPEIKSTRHGNKNDIFAVVRTPKGDKDVNLRDYLRESGRLTPKVQRLLDNLSEGAMELKRGAEAMSRGLPDAASFTFSADGRLQASMQTEKNLSRVNIEDYLNDLKRDLEKNRGRLDSKREEARELAKEQTIERAKDLTRGPELDNASLNAMKAKAELDLLKMATPDASGEGASKERKEAKRTADELVTLDAMSDKAKLLESLKATHEVKQIESSIKEVMKNMEEAERNRDLLDDLKKNPAKSKVLE